MHTAKYRSSRVRAHEVGDFDSKAEFKRWNELKELEAEGKIKNLARQVKFQLIPAQKLIEPRIDRKGRKHTTERAITYVADFIYTEDGRDIIEDVKGFITPEYIIKRKLMLYVYGIEIREVY